MNKKKKREIRSLPPLEFQEQLLRWYQKKKRVLPWREDEPDFYSVWISEIMLQQTRVEAVKEYYKRFKEKLPDWKRLAEVEDEVLHKLWEGLGYYNRAKNLKKAAQMIEKEYDGQPPSTYRELIKLPGIGPYTAGAIASIVFLEAVPAVDGNVMRVMTRLTGIDRDITEMKTRKEIAEVVEGVLPRAQVNHFNQALMELGALVCIPNGKPKCEVCPVKRFCYAYKNEKQEELPVKKAKKERKKEKRTVLIFETQEGKRYLRKRGEKGLLPGLWEFPSLDGELLKQELFTTLNLKKIRVQGLEQLKKAKHTFSHIEWDMFGYRIKIHSEQENNVGEFCSSFWNAGEDEETKRRFGKEAWVSIKEMKETFSIPSAFGAFLRFLENEEKE